MDGWIVNTTLNIHEDTLPGPQKSCQFDLNQQIVVLWSGVASVGQVKSAEFLNVLNDQVLPSFNFFFPDDSCIFQDNNAKIHRALVVEEWSMRTHKCQGSMRSHFHTWIDHHKSPDLTPIKVLGMCWKRLKEWFASPVISTKSWPKMNATLDRNKCCDISCDMWHKVVKTMPQQMHVIKAKGGPTKYKSVRFFLWTGSVYFNY